MNRNICILLLLLISTSTFGGEVLLENRPIRVIPNGGPYVYQRIAIALGEERAILFRVKAENMADTLSIINPQDKNGLNKVLELNVSPSAIKGPWTGGYRFSIIGEDVVGKDVVYIIAVMPKINRSPGAHTDNIPDEIFLVKIIVKPDGTVVGDLKGTSFLEGNIRSILHLNRRMRAFKNGDKYVVKFRTCDVCETSQQEI